MYAGFHRVEMRIADYILAHSDTIADRSMTEIAEAVHAAPSSVIRFSKILGYEGYGKCGWPLQSILPSKAVLLCSPISMLQTRQKS